METSQERYRHVLLGAFVVIGLGLLLLGMLQSKAVREWLNPSKVLRLVLPDEGLFGLSQGAKIEVLGTPAGEVARIVIDPDQKIHAEVRIDPSMSPFVRRDSKAIIRKTFGVAGDAYVEITRGRGEPMDWDYAVLTAEADRTSIESIGDMLQEVRSRVMPILAQTERTATALAGLTERLADPKGSLQIALSDVSKLTTRVERGEGSMGRLLASDAAAREIESLLASSNATLQALGPILENLKVTAAHAASLSASIDAQSKDMPQAGEKLNAILVSLDQIMRDLARSSPNLPQVTRDVGTATASVPVLLGATQQTLTELDALLRQLRGHWLLGGDGAATQPAGARLPPREVRP